MQFEESTVARMRERSFVKMVLEAAEAHKIEVPDGVNIEKIGETVAAVLARDEFAAEMPKYNPSDVMKVTEFAINNGGRLNSKDLADLSL